HRTFISMAFPLQLSVRRLIDLDIGYRLTVKNGDIGDIFEHENWLPRICWKFHLHKGSVVHVLELETRPRVGLFNLDFDIVHLNAGGVADEEAMRWCFAEHGGFRIVLLLF